LTKRLPFTQASLKRAILAAREAGLRITGIRPDGTLLVEDASLAADRERQNTPQDDPWKDVQA
jgi:hypothetical protein